MERQPCTYKLKYGLMEVQHKICEENAINPFLLKYWWIYSQTREKEGAKYHDLFWVFFIMNWTKMSLIFIQHFSNPL